MARRGKAIIEEEFDRIKQIIDNYPDAKDSDISRTTGRPISTVKLIKRFTFEEYKNYVYIKHLRKMERKRKENTSSGEDAQCHDCSQETCDAEINDDSEDTNETEISAESECVQTQDDDSSYTKNETNILTVIEELKHHIDDNTKGIIDDMESLLIIDNPKYGKNTIAEETSFICAALNVQKKEIINRLDDHRKNFSSAMAQLSIRLKSMESLQATLINTNSSILSLKKEFGEQNKYLEAICECLSVMVSAQTKTNDLLARLNSTWDPNFAEV